MPLLSPNRRRIVFASAAALLSPDVLAALLRTPGMTEGPFYPVELPLDDDNDLTQVKGQAGPAKGELLDLTGRVLDEQGRAKRNAQVEIWQCNANGRYHHPGDSGGDRALDPRFQGFGKTVTDAEGRYRFRTIKPVAYPGRPAGHIHFKVKSRETGEFTSQIFVAGDPGNDRDGVLRSIRDAKARERVMMTLKPAAAQNGVALAGEFDIVLG